MTFHQPSVWFLLLLGLLPLIWWRRARDRRGRGMTFSATAPLRAVRVSWAVRLAWIVPALRSIVLVLLVIALARPRKADEHTRIFSEGIAIQLLVDRSGSMLALDFELDGRPVNRLEAVKRVVERFVTGGDDLAGRADDLVGLITFGTYADAVCPLTLDHGHLVETVRRTEVSADREDQATAIGDAVALGVERMHRLERRADLRGADRVKSQVMILLTDGENTAGDIDPQLAAEMAASFGIKIYTIGAGTTDGRAPMPGTDLFGRPIIQHVPVSIDEAMLRSVAETTGGAYFRATDSTSLEAVYARIDELERTEIEQRRYTDYEEISVASVRVAGLDLPPLLAVALVLLAVDIILGNTRFRRLP